MVLKVMHVVIIKYLIIYIKQIEKTDKIEIAEIDVNTPYSIADLQEMMNRRKRVVYNMGVGPQYDPPESP